MHGIYCMLFIVYIYANLCKYRHDIIQMIFITSREFIIAGDGDDAKLSNDLINLNIHSWLRISGTIRGMISGTISGKCGERGRGGR